MVRGQVFPTAKEQRPEATNVVVGEDKRETVRGRVQGRAIETGRHVSAHMDMVNSES